MKKSLLLTVTFVLMVAGAWAQSFNLQITGTVTQLNTNTPIVNHAVTIMSDSSFGTNFNYYNQVFTNNQGVYDDFISIPAGLTVVFSISTIDCQGYVHSQSVVVTGAGVISADFSICFNPTNPCQASYYFVPDPNTLNSIHFVSTSTGSSLTYSWDFGDGGSASTQDPHHTFTQSGVYLVCLTISGANNCQSTYCDSIFVGITNPCNALFTYSVNPATYLVEFTDLSTGNPTAWSWSFGDGTSSLLQNPHHTYAFSGTYVVTLTISGNGCTSTYTMTISIGAPGSCNAEFTYSIDSNATNTYHFESVAPGNLYQYNWNFGDGGTAFTADPHHTFAQNGTYVVCLTIYGPNGCQDTWCDTIVVGTNPGPCSNYISFTTQGNVVHFIGHASGGTAPFTFAWDFGDGGSATTHDPLHTYAQPGTYTVTLTTTDANGCTFISTVVVTITMPSTCNIWGHVWAGNSLLDFGYVYLYYGGQGTILNLIDSTQLDSAGIYQFSNVAVINGHYYVKAEPTANSAFFLTHLPTYYGHTLYWANATPIFTPQLSNPYNIELIPVIAPNSGNGNIGGQVTTGNKSFSANGAPAADVEVLLLNANNQAIGLKYSDASGYFSFTNLAMGTYKLYAEVTGLTTNPAIVTLSTSNPSVNNSSIIITPSGVITNINEPIENVFDIQNIYPNPGSETTYLELSLLKTNKLNISLLNLVGQKITASNVELTAGFHKISVNLQDIPSGTYFLQVQTQEGNSHSSKITVIK